MDKVFIFTDKSGPLPVPQIEINNNEEKGCVRVVEGALVRVLYSTSAWFYALDRPKWVGMTTATLVRYKRPRQDDVELLCLQPSRMVATD